MNLTPRRAVLHARWYRAQGREDDAQVLDDYVTAAGCCRRCGRTLTDPRSIERGIGPECDRNPTPDAA